MLLDCVATSVCRLGGRRVDTLVRPCWLRVSKCGGLRSDRAGVRVIVVQPPASAFSRPECIGLELNLLRTYFLPAY